MHLAFSDSDAYLWHLASLRKSYRYLHPDTLTVWHAIQYAHQRGFKHLHFMDVAYLGSEIRIENSFAASEASPWQNTAGSNATSASSTD